MNRTSIVSILSLILFPLVFLFGFDKSANPNIRLQLSDELIIHGLSDGVFLVTHSFPWPCNSLVVQSENGDIYMVDTPCTPEATGLIIGWVKECLGPENIVAIVTGFHIDNLGGVSYLIENGIPVHGSDLTVELLKTDAKRSHDAMLPWLKGSPLYDYYSNLILLPPNHVFPLQDGLLLKSGEETIEVWYPGASHSPDNTTVYFHSKKLLFGGCAVKSADSTKLGNTFDADIDNWPNAIDALIQRYPEATLVIPGHGKQGDRSLLFHTRSLFHDDSGSLP
ncbi:MAG: MBL fold metallo-hydrolase [Opitutales bacterium]|nr:MBL fold metallo-hydrolase [Opitutales bacterium]